MRLRLALWLTLLAVQFLATAFPPEAVAPVLAGAVYLPLSVLREAGLPVFLAAESGGWQSPSLFGWAAVVSLWTVVWWVVASVVSQGLAMARNERV
jgi:hypothetical protein